MPTINYTDIGRQLLILIGQVLILILCIFYIKVAYQETIVPDQLVSTTFRQANCLVVDKELSKRGIIFPRYRTDFLLSYSVEGRNYKSWASGNGLNHSYLLGKNSEQKILDTFKQNQTYPCWYNPNAPQIVVLVLRSDWSSEYSLVIPAIIILMMFLYACRTVSRLLKMLRRSST